MCFQPKTLFYSKAALPVVDFHPRMLFSMKQFLFLWLANTGLKPFFKNSRVKLQKLLKSCWPSKMESWLWWVTCWKNFVRNRGVAMDFLEGASKTSEMSATVVDQSRKCWVAELLKGQFSDPFQWDFTYSNLPFLVAELFSLP